MRGRPAIGCGGILACVIVIVIVGLAIVINGGRGRRSSVESRSFSPSMVEEVKGKILLTETGSGTAVFPLVVPEYCFGQDLDYVANRHDAARPASVRFVVMRGNDEVRTTGPKNVERTGDTRGAGVWSLDDDRHYTLTVYSDNAEWMLIVRCR